MELKIRQRLVGAVVIIALAIIFVPMFFKNTNSMLHHKVALNSNAPSSPATNNGTQIILADQNNTSQPQPQQQQTPQPQPISNVNQSQAIAANQAAILGNPANTSIVKKTDNQLAFGSEAEKMSAATLSSAKPKKVKPATVVVQKEKSQPVITKAQQLSFAQQTVQAEIAGATAANITTPTPAAWVVQLGSFSNNTNAKKLVAELRVQGFTAFSRVVKTSSSDKIKVFVGPEVRRNKADALQAKLDHDLHVKGVVVAFDPLQIK